MKVKALPVIVAICLSACVSNDLKLVTIQGKLNTESVVKERQDIVFITSDDEIRVEVLSIQEARCPSDVTCIWGGYVHVTLRINVTNQTLTLSIPPDQPTGQGFSDHYTFAFSGDTYRLQLKDVIPYPTRKNSDAVKSAVFELTRLD
jgi:hypothetical protein